MARVPGTRVDELSETLTVEIPAFAAFELRWVLPLIVEALIPADDDGSTTTMLDQVARCLSEAMPQAMRDAVDEKRIAEYRMDAVEAQRAAGVRIPDRLRGFDAEDLRLLWHTASMAVSLMDQLDDVPKSAPLYGKRDRLSELARRLDHEANCAAAQDTSVEEGEPDA